MLQHPSSLAVKPVNNQLCLIFAKFSSYQDIHCKPSTTVAGDKLADLLKHFPHSQLF
jgi:hypothetical protein